MSASISTDHNGITHVDADLYKAATNGNFGPFENYQSLDYLRIGKNRNTILHLHLNSPCERSTDFVEKVLRKCPRLLLQANNEGNIPLHIAAKYDHLEIVKLLILEARKKTDRDLEIGDEEAARQMMRVKNKQDETALHLADRVNSRSVVDEILKHVDPNTHTAYISGESRFCLAAKKELHELTNEIWKKFAPPNRSDPNGSRSFHEAAPISKDRLAESSFDEMLNKLSGIINNADKIGWTPLHWAAYLGKSLVVRHILEKNKCSAYAIDREMNRTALHLASCRGRVGIMKEMIEKFPDCCEITDARGRNMLHYAVISGDEEAVKTVMKDSSLVYFIKEPDIRGYTPYDLLFTYDDLSPLLSWLHKDKSPLPSQFFRNKEMNIGYKLEGEILEWMEDLGKDPCGIKIVGKVHRRLREKQIEETIIPETEKAKDSHLVAAALVATVTFAAAFTLPGGYISDENDSKLKGTPILSRNAAFKAFVLTDAIAMVLSTSSVFMHLIMVLLGYKRKYFWLMRSAFWFIVTAMGAMVVAFVTGTYAVLATNSKDLAVATCVIGLTFFSIVIYIFLRLVCSFIKRDRAENRSSSMKESIDRLQDCSHDYLLHGHKCSYWFNCNRGSTIAESVDRLQDHIHHYLLCGRKCSNWFHCNRDPGVPQVHSNSNDEVKDERSGAVDVLLGSIL